MKSFKQLVCENFFILLKILGGLFLIQFLLRVFENIFCYLYDPERYQFFGLTDGVIPSSFYFLAFFLGYQWVGFLVRFSQDEVAAPDLWPKFILPAFLCGACFFIFLLPLEILIQQYLSSLIFREAFSFSYLFILNTFFLWAYAPLLFFAFVFFQPIRPQTSPDFGLFKDALFFLPLFIAIERVFFDYACYLSEHALMLLFLLTVFFKGSEVFVMGKRENRLAIPAFHFVLVIFPAFWLIIVPGLMTFNHAVCGDYKF